MRKPEPHNISVFSGNTNAYEKAFSPEGFPQCWQASLAWSTGVKKCAKEAAVRVGYPSAGPRHSSVSNSSGSTSDDNTWGGEGVLICWLPYGNHLTIDHACLSRRGTAPIPNRHLQHLGANYFFCLYQVYYIKNVLGGIKINPFRTAPSFFGTKLLGNSVGDFL